MCRCCWRRTATALIADREAGGDHEMAPSLDRLTNAAPRSWPVSAALELACNQQIGLHGPGTTS
jgi:hypothetical protein